MLKVLLCTTVPVTLRAFLMPLADHFRSCGWQVDAATNGMVEESPGTRRFTHVWQIPWHRNPLHPANFFSAIHRIREVVVQQRYDIVHVHTPVAAFLARYALRGLPSDSRPVVVYTAHGFHFHEGGSPIRNAMFRALEKSAGPWTDYLVVINREDEAAARRLRLVPGDRLWYIPGIGVDTQLLTPERISEEEVRQFRLDLGIPPDHVLFLMIAEFNKGKRHHDAVLALAKCRHQQTRLVLAGTGPQVETVKRLAEALGVAGRVHFLGFRRDVPVLLRASRASILPSEREGLPRSVLESLSLAVPVLGTAVRGIRDLVAPECGRLVPVGDADALASAMDWFAEHPEQADAMGWAGRAVAAKYDIRKILKLYDSLYMQALGERA